MAIFINPDPIFNEWVQSAFNDKTFTVDVDQYFKDKGYPLPDETGMPVTDDESLAMVINSLIYSAKVSEDINQITGSGMFQDTEGMIQYLRKCGMTTASTPKDIDMEISNYTLLWYTSTPKWNIKPSPDSNMVDQVNKNIEANTQPNSIYATFDKEYRDFKFSDSKLSIYKNIIMQKSATAKKLSDISIDVSGTDLSVKYVVDWLIASGFSGTTYKMSEFSEVGTITLG